MLGKGPHWQVIPQQSTQNIANLPLQTYEKTSGLFLLYSMDVDFSSCKNVANLVSVPVQSAIPCYLLTDMLSTNKHSVYFFYS